MAEHRKIYRCLGCGKKTRRSRCSACRKVRDAAKVVARGGRYARKARRQNH